MKTISKLRALGLTTACALLSAQVAFAADDAKVVQAAYIEDVGPTERINNSGKLRMLSQRIAAAACYHGAGVDGARDILHDAEKEFHDILAALEFGDDSRGIHGAESRKKTLVKIKDVHTVWDPFEVSVDEVLAGAVDDAHINHLLSESSNVLETAKVLVSEISAQYSNPAEMTQAGAIVIDIAGRQRMLTQKMAKEACAAWTGRSDTAAADLAGTMQIFEGSLAALIDGMPGAGIKRPPTKEIAAGLQVVKKDWAEVQGALASIAAGNAVDNAEISRVFHMLNNTLVDMNKVVVLYSAAERIELG